MRNVDPKTSLLKPSHAVDRTLEGARKAVTGRRCIDNRTYFWKCLPTVVVRVDSDRAAFTAFERSNASLNFAKPAKDFGLRPSKQSNFIIEGFQAISHKDHPYATVSLGLIWLSHSFGR
jgi:hypothetical protein